LNAAQTTLPKVDVNTLDNLDLNKRQGMLSKYLRIHPFTPNTLLGKIFNVNDETIRKDKKKIVESGMSWGDDLAQGAFMVECAEKLSIMEEVIQEEYGQFKMQQKRGTVLAATKNRLFRYSKEKLETINDVPLYHKYMKWEIKMAEEGLG